MSFTLLGILNSQAAAAGGGPAYDLLETVELASPASDITFTNIDQSYSHLQLRMTFQASAGFGTFGGMPIEFNSDSGSNYDVHYLDGNGSSVSSGNSLNQTRIVLFGSSIGSTYADIFGTVVLDILDYTNTNKNTTVRSLQGGNSPADNSIVFQSGLYRSTSAISSIKIAKGYEQVTGSRFSLYGIKG